MIHPPLTSRYLKFVGFNYWQTICNWPTSLVKAKYIFIYLDIEIPAKDFPCVKDYICVILYILLYICDIIVVIWCHVCIKEGNHTRIEMGFAPSAQPVSFASNSSLRTNIMVNYIIWFFIWSFNQCIQMISIAIICIKKPSLPCFKNIINLKIDKSNYMHLDIACSNG